MKPTFRSHLRGMLLIVSSVCLMSCGNDRHEQRRVLLPAGEVHEGWYFAAGERVVIQGTVNGDAYVAGGNVQSTAPSTEICWLPGDR